MAANAYSTNQKVVGGLLAVVVIVGAFFLLTMPDRRTPTEKLGDAIHELPKGIDKAGDQLKDRTPAQQLGDKLDDVGDNLKRQ